MPHSGNQQHHAHRNAGGRGSAKVTPPTRVSYRITLLLSFGFFVLVVGLVFMVSGSSSLTIPGIVLLSVGVSFSVLGVALFCRLYRQYRQPLPAANHQHARRCTTVVYGQPGTTPGIVQPQTPGASMTHGQPGMHPIIQTRTRGPANIMFRPGGGVMYLPGAQTNHQAVLYTPGAQTNHQAVLYLPGAQTNVQPDVPRSPGASAPPRYSEIDPEAPPPAYEEVVKPDTDPGEIGVD